MTKRERFWRATRHEEAGRLPFWADWLGPLERWRADGMPVEECPGDFSPRQIETFLFPTG